MTKNSVFIRIRNLVRQIPLGRVSTYGLVAKAANTKSPRVVGWALRGNQDSTLPCHRVVQKGGTISPNYSLGGYLGQRRRLEKEGLKFKGRQIIDFDSFLYRFDRPR
jgi:methylated-DNA-protein-cysteine methyltransferase-like protein